MRHSDYWRERFEKLEKAQNANGIQYVKRVQKEYDKAIKSLDKDISYWYTRFAKENGVSYAEAKRLLSTQELKAFRMDVKEYISKGESLDPKWRAELEQASVKVHVSRLEALKLQVQQAAESVSGEFAESFDEFARKTYADQYYKTAYEIQKGLKVGWDVMRLDKNKIDKVIRKPWVSDGRNFSERVWANRSKLVNELHTTLTQGIIRGDSPQKTIAALSKRMDVSKVAAGRLIMTEHAFFSSAANRDVLKELEVEKYEILATLDSRTSQTCRDMDGKVFNRSEYEVGITAPPFHVWCRTTTVPYFDDGEEGFRAARNKDGEYYLVPEKMTYREWEKTFVEGGSKEGLEKATPEALASAVLAIDRNCALFKSYGESHYLNVHETIENNGSEDQLAVWGAYESELGVTTTRNRGSGAYFNPRDKGITLNLERDSNGSNWERPYQTTFHEMGHNIDWIAGGKHPSGATQGYYSVQYKDGAFVDSLYEEVNGYIDEIEKELKAGFKDGSARVKWYKKKVNPELPDDWDPSKLSFFKYKKAFTFEELSDRLKKIPAIERSALSDIFEGVTGGKVNAGFGHGTKYWKIDRGQVALEAFAEFWECVANPEQLERIKTWLPKSTKIFEEMIKNLAEKVGNNG